MNEALDTIRYQRDELRQKNEYIKSLETVTVGMGAALTVCAAALFYLYLI